MRLVMNISGIEFHFQIHNYSKSKTDDWDSEWSKLSLKTFCTELVKLRDKI